MRDESLEVRFETNLLIYSKDLRIDMEFSFPSRKSTGPTDRIYNNPNFFLKCKKIENYFIHNLQI